ncbi:MAG: hypothetical protein JWM68_1077 [Verrucomicrobiales bacterium]|nr:hypothetical protein [Verrucomicrobiales bacterium]
MLVTTNVFAVEDTFSHFIGIKKFSSFAKSKTETGETVLLSPDINAFIPWNELVVSWNASAPSNTFVKIEAAAIFGDHKSKFYTVATWSPDNAKFTRTSVRGQKDSDGTVDTDTLIVPNLATGTQIRVTLGGEGKRKPDLKFIGLSFSNTKIPTTSLPSNHAAWGKIISTPEKSQHGYPNESGWCSPTSLSMVLTRWSDVLHRPEMKLDVPEVAEAVYDEGWHATGNWPFNTAFAGSFKNMRSYVTRFSDISELEDWVAAGIPVIISGPWYLFEDGRGDSGSGHLTVCVGFTETGDVVINDPGTKVGASVRHIYKRQNVLNSWAKSHHTVYLVYPESAKLPKDRFGHWDK